MKHNMLYYTIYYTECFPEERFFHRHRWRSGRPTPRLLLGQEASPGSCPRVRAPKKSEDLPVLRTHREGTSRSAQVRAYDDGACSFCKELLCFRTMPCHPMPLLVHFWQKQRRKGTGQPGPQTDRCPVFVSPAVSRRHVYVKFWNVCFPGGYYSIYIYIYTHSTTATTITNTYNNNDNNTTTNNDDKPLYGQGISTCSSEMYVSLEG